MTAIILSRNFKGGLVRKSGPPCGRQDPNEAETCQFDKHPHSYYGFKFAAGTCAWGLILFTGWKNTSSSQFFKGNLL